MPLPPSKATTRRYTFEDIHKAIFPTPPEPRTLEELKEAVAEYIRQKHARR
ncbi:MAG TPA: hypothetical protein VGF28_03875 [Thermoanaerobaculia bacterium]|jgi:hypothetical protein